MSLRGRASECAMLDALVGDIRRAESRSLVAAIAQAEMWRFVWLDILPDTGSGCPANEGAAQQTPGRMRVLTGVEVFGGPMTFGELRRLGAAGSYLACAYFHKDVRHGHNDEIGKATAQASFTVVPPCVVPHRVVGEPGARPVAWAARAPGGLDRQAAGEAALISDFHP
jgi:hypothetical protein